MYDTVFPSIEPLRSRGPQGALMSRLLSRLTPGAAEIQTLERDQAAVISELLAYIADTDRQLAEQRQRIARLEALSMTDELTGIANRRAFERRLQQALAAAERHGEPGVLGFFDLDDFKAINDRFGHEAGDSLLKAVADRLQAQLRQDDCVARLGGDEFAVILVRCPAHAGRAKLRAMQASLSELPSPAADNGAALSVSLGIRAFRAGDRFKDILLDADREMYRQKRGRQGLALAAVG